MSDKAVRFLRKDPLLGKIIKSVGPYRISLIENPYESLVEAIITQQLSSKAAESISSRFRKIYKKYPHPAEVLKTPDSKLAEAGLSKMKIVYIKDLSSRLVSKKLRLDAFEGMDDEQVILELTKVKGIGRWTAEMFLIFSLGRLDVLPLGDLGLRKGIQTLHSLPEIPSDETIRDLAESWRPYRTVATWYLWKGIRQFDGI